MAYCSVAASAKTVDEGKTKWFGRKAVNYLLITVTGGVALSALDDLIIYQSCSRYVLNNMTDLFAQIQNLRQLHWVFLTKNIWNCFS